MAGAAWSVAMFSMTVEEIAEVLSRDEGRPVTVHEVQRVEFQAMRKLRRELERRGLTAELIMPSSDW